MNRIITFTITAIIVFSWLVTGSPITESLVSRIPGPVQWTIAN